MLRVTEMDWNTIRDHVLADAPREGAALVLTRRVAPDVHVCVDIVPLGTAELDVQQTDRLVFGPEVIAPHLRRARREGLGIFTVHSHPCAKRARFSWADDKTDQRLLQAVGLHAEVAGALVVAGSGHVTARIAAPDGMRATKAVSIGSVVRDLTIDGDIAAATNEVFARQRLLLGDAGQALLRSATVGVVGVGGIGSIVAVVLAHLGVGRLVLVDGDCLEASNVSRVLCSSRDDIGQPKVHLVATYIRRLGLGAEIAVNPSHLTEDSVSTLGSCDAIVSCVDRHTPRMLLNRLAYAGLVPLIDTGVALRVDGAGALIGDNGRVVVVGPGRRCLACWGHLDPDALRVEALNEDERDDLLAEGYIAGATVAQPAVITFNTQVAGAAASEVLRLLTGFASGPDRQVFSFRRGEVRRARLGRNGCSICRTS